MRQNKEVADLTLRNAGDVEELAVISVSMD